jgi:hypothetical protein
MVANEFMFAFALLANAITADMGMIPGFAPAGPALGLPLSVLAAFLERPFYTRAGVERGALRLSLQANFLSLLAGFVGIFFFAPLVMSPGGAIFGWLVPLSAVSLSIWIEGSYLRSAIRPRRLAGVWVIFANVFSACMCIIVMVATRIVRESYPAFAREFRPIETPLGIGLAVVCLAVLLGSFYDPYTTPIRTPDMASKAIESRADVPSEAEPAIATEQSVGPKND